MRNRTAIGVAATLAAAWGSGAAAQELVEAWRLGGFAMPESATWDEAAGHVVVSEIGVFGPDGGADGTLSLVSAEGELLQSDWVTGLIDPKGMASLDGRLYVADADGVKVVDSATGAMVETIAVPGAMLLNDVAVLDGAVYVTDMMAGGVWRLRDGAVEPAVAAGGVPLPNGILAHDGGLIVGSFGDEMQADFSVATPGGLLTIDAAGAVTPVAGTAESASVDGIAAVGDWVVYDDNPTGRILGWRDGTLATLGETAPGAADLSAAGDLLVIPFLNTGEVAAYRIEG